MISHKHKCIFVHIPKAAGTSIEMAFLHDLNLDMKNRHALLIGENTNSDLGPRRISHLAASEYFDQHYISQDLFSTYFKFAFIRNPFDRLYSTYRYRRFNDFLSFDTFIKTKFDKLAHSASEGFFYKSQYDYLYKDDFCLVDFVGRFENLNEDFQEVKKRVSSKTLTLEHYNKSSSSTNLNRLIRIAGKSIKNINLISGFSFNKNLLTLSEYSREKIIEFYLQDFEKFNYSKSI